MQDDRIVKLLVRNQEGKFLVLRHTDYAVIKTERPDLLGGLALFDEDDVTALDRILRDTYNIFLQTQEAIQIGYDVEYEPGVGATTRVLYLLKLNRSQVVLDTKSSVVHFDWLSKQQLRGFEPAYQVLVQTAVDFYLPVDE